MIFISHSSADEEQSAEMRDRLEAAGYGWLFLDFDVQDVRGIQAGRSAGFLRAALEMISS